MAAACILYWRPPTFYIGGRLYSTLAAAIVESGGRVSGIVHGRADPSRPPYYETILSVRGAAKRFNVPVETLRRRVTGSVDMNCRPGPRPVFSKREEEKLSNYCIQMADMGFGLSKEDIMRSAFLLAEKSGLKHPFKNGKAGRAWFEGFLSRNPQLSIRQAQSLSVARATSANKEIIRFFW